MKMSPSGVWAIDTKWPRVPGRRIASSSEILPLLFKVIAYMLRSAYDTTRNLPLRAGNLFYHRISPGLE